MKFFSSKLFYTFLGIFVLLLTGAFVWWGITVGHVAYASEGTVDEALLQKIQACSSGLEGNTFFTINETALVKRVMDCDPRIVSVSVQKSFPQNISIKYTVIHPVVVLNAVDKVSCLLVEAFSVMRTVGSDLCVLYSIPDIQGRVTAENKFTLSYVAELVALLQKQNIQVNYVVAQGDATITYYEVNTVEKKKLLFPDGANLEQEVATAKASIKGLEEAKEGYSVVDMRFDRVVYR